MFDLAEERCPLDDVLNLLRVRGAVMAHLRAHAPWGLRLPRAAGATFHVVTAGSCWLRIAGEIPRELLPGDVVLLPHGAPHSLASSSSGPTQAWDRAAKLKARNAAGELVLPGTGNSTHLFCATYDYDHEVTHPFLSFLPTVLVVPGNAIAPNSPMQSTLQLLRYELASPGPGRGTVIGRLIDVLFVHIVRTWILGRDDLPASWLAALRDPAIGRALTVMHSAPAAAWTIDLLAREVCLSRAAFTRRFTALVGEPPLAYLTHWRMDLAAQHLRDTSDAVGAIAHRVGYTSEFAFSRAFSRERGQAPGRYRAEKRRTL
ncbi:MAG TPA: AraC family transcriptional regulator [Gemmatimonadaceae bacterium]|nr:AraC family transcriptional regulator [Gemmatimonadaceae bacterium]